MPGEDLAVLWTLWNCTECVLAHVSAGWEIRVQRLGKVLRSRVVPDGASALLVGEHWYSEFSQAAARAEIAARSTAPPSAAKH